MFAQDSFASLVAKQIHDSISTPNKNPGLGGMELAVTNAPLRALLRLKVAQNLDRHYEWVGHEVLHIVSHTAVRYMLKCSCTQVDAAMVLSVAAVAVAVYTNISGNSTILGQALPLHSATRPGTVGQTVATADCHSQQPTWYTMPWKTWALASVEEEANRG